MTGSLLVSQESTESCGVETLAFAKVQFGILQVKSHPAYRAEGVPEVILCYHHLFTRTNGNVTK